jgi:hypothetical protein
MQYDTGALLNYTKTANKIVLYQVKFHRTNICIYFQQYAHTSSFKYNTTNEYNT